MAEPTPNAEGLLRAARGGSWEALGRVLEAWRGYLFRIADRELAPDLRAKGGAADLVQQTFLEARRDFATFRGDSADELRSWLRQLLLNNLANFTRDYRGRTVRQVGREAIVETGLADDLSAPDGQSVVPEQAEDVRRALARLSEDHQRVIRLRHQEDLPFEEVGRRMGLSASAARLLWLRAVERLQAELGGPP
jgi:RNA polymerase sigma-70 factor (ECF subfamily)